MNLKLKQLVYSQRSVEQWIKCKVRPPKSQYSFKGRKGRRHYVPILQCFFFFLFQILYIKTFHLSNLSGARLIPNRCKQTHFFA